MKKILFILSVLITSLSFASPKDWIDENKVKKAGYEITLEFVSSKIRI